MKKLQVSLSEVDLTYLKITLERSQPGMSDFIAEVRVLESKTDERVLIRGSRETTKPEGATKIAKAAFATFAKKEEKSFDWEAANVDYLSKMLMPHIKYFGLNTSVQKLTFITDALK